MLTKKIAFIILVNGCLVVAAQPTIKWAENISGKGHQWISDVASDESGNIYVAGDFQDVTTFDMDAVKLQPSDVNGLFVAKYNMQGKFVWVKQLCGESSLEASKIAVDPFGNVYFSGNFSPTLFVPDNREIDTLKCRDGKDNTFICKFNSEGKVLWLKHFESQYHNDPGDIAVDSQGNLLCVGRFETMIDLDPGKETKICNMSKYETSEQWPDASGFEVFVVQLDTSGNLVWSHHLASTGDCFAYGIAVDANDKVYCTGTYDGNLFVYDLPNPRGLPSNSTNSSFVLKMDDQGRIVWNKSLAIADVDLWADDMVIDKDGNIFLQGIFRDDATFNTKIPDGYIKSKGEMDFFLCCLNNKGEVQWAKQFGGEGSDHCNDLCIDDESNIYISGHFYKPIDFDPGPKEHIKQPVNGENIFLVKVDKMGKFQWVYTAGGEETDQMWAWGVCWNKLSGLCLSGFFRSASLNLGNDHILTNAGSSDGFVAVFGDASGR